MTTISFTQTETATVSGRVVDQQGGVVQGADVVITNVDTNVTSRHATNGSGLYVLSGVKPGRYRITVTKGGFQTINLTNVVLHVQDSVSQNFKLQVGSVSQSITVVADEVRVNSESASVSTVIDESYVKNMPLNGRSLQDLILLTPGVVTQTPQAFSTGLGQTGEFSVNGQRTESNYFTVDGVSANVGTTVGRSMLQAAGSSGSVSAATALGTTQALVSLDDLQEFRVQSSTYSAEYGRNPGGQFAFETKSGTNQWHGAAYDYLRNGALDAKDWFNNYFQLPEPPIKQNDFGGTFGGPVEIPGVYHGKGKSFFFVSYEGLRLTSPQPAASSVVPDLCLRGATSNCPSGVTPAPGALQPVLNAFPSPTGSEALMTVSCDPATDPNCSPGGTKQVPSGLANYVASWSNPSSINSTSLRFDHLVNEKLRLFFRFNNTGSDSVNRGGSFTPATSTASAYTLRTYTLGASSVFSGSLSDEFRLNYTSNEATSQAVINAFGGSTPVNLAQLSGLDSSARFTVQLHYGGYDSKINQGLNSGSQKQWNLVNTLSFASRRHQFRFGVDYRRLTPFAVPPSPAVQYLYNGMSNVEANSSNLYVQAETPAHPLYTNFSAFAQDEWRVSQRLSLSLGLRWEVNPAPGVTEGLKPYTVQGSGPDTWTLAPQGTPLWRTTWYNFAPRLGVAYLLRNVPGHETVVRGGGGVFFDTGQQLGSLSFTGPGFVAFTKTTQPFPGSVVVPAIVNPPVPPYPGGVFGFASHLQLPYTLQWNTSIEQALGKSQAISFSYVGSHASRSLQQNDFSANGSFFRIIQNGLTSDYDSLQVQFRRRLSRDLTALASYTWSHCLDYGSENFNLSYQRGNCDYDVRHNFSGAFSYDLPNARGNAFVKAVVRSWGMDSRFTARTAFPVTLFGFGLVQPNGQIYDEGLNIVPGQSIYLYGANCVSVLQGLGDLPPGKGCPGGRAINPNAFVSVNSGLGNAPRNFARGFGAWQVNLAIRREFLIHENLKLQFRAEAFNIFNHSNFGSIDGGFGANTFGQATATLANSLSVLNPLYQMGGSRSTQFALKFVF